MYMKKLLLYKIIAEEVQKTVVNESVGFFFDDHDNSKPQNLLDLTFHLGVSLNKIMNKANAFEKKRFSDERPSEILAPDGSGAFNDMGIINFYIVGWPERLLGDAVEEIKKEIKKIGIQLGGVKGPEKSNSMKSDVIRFQINKMDTDTNPPPQVSFSNMNFMKIMRDFLGIKDIDYSGTMAIGDLVMRLNNAKKRLGDFPVNTAHNVMRKTDQRGGMYGPTDLGQDYYRNVIDLLENLIRYARKNNYTTISYA